ncbi:MAG: hypothetical protein ACI841_004957 [Planctomycetota bacterium]
MFALSFLHSKGLAQVRSYVLSHALAKGSAGGTSIRSGAFGVRILITSNKAAVSIVALTLLIVSSGVYLVNSLESVGSGSTEARVALTPEPAVRTIIRADDN